MRGERTPFLADLIPAILAGLISGASLVLALLVGSLTNPGGVISAPLNGAQEVSLDLIRGGHLTPLLDSRRMACEVKVFGDEREMRCEGPPSMDPFLVVFVHLGPEDTPVALAGSVASQDRPAHAIDKAAADFFAELSQLMPASIGAEWVHANINGGSAVYEGAHYIILSEEGLRLFQVVTVPQSD
jgi:hypothetical protein